MTDSEAQASSREPPVGLSSPLLNGKLDSADSVTPLILFDNPARSRLMVSTYSATDRAGNTSHATATVTVVPAAMPDDIDGDGDVDRDDLNLALAAQNQPASGPDDPRDLDGDGMITALDARKLIVIMRSQ